MWPLASSTKDLIFTLAGIVVSIAHILNFLPYFLAYKTDKRKGNCKTALR